MADKHGISDANLTSPEGRAKLERRLTAITRCSDKLDAIKHYPPNALLNTLGQLDWLGELHALPYDENYEFWGTPRADISYEMVVELCVKFMPRS
jgi:hypothetical protein